MSTPIGLDAVSDSDMLVSRSCSYLETAHLKHTEQQKVSEKQHCQLTLLALPRSI
jgi:hypothetical protein